MEPTKPPPDNEKDEAKDMMTSTEMTYSRAPAGQPAGNRFAGKISDLDIQSLVDGGLAPRREVELRRAIESDDSLRVRYRELLEQKRLLALWWRQFS